MENMLISSFPRCLAHTRQPLGHAYLALCRARVESMSVLLKSTPFPPHSPPAVSRFCSNDSSVLWRCPTPRKRACETCGFRLLPPSCRLRSLQAFPRSPGSRCMEFPDVRGVCDYAGPAGNSRLVLPSCCLPPVVTVSGAPDRKFSKLDTQPHLCPCLRFTERFATHGAKLGPSGSLLLLVRLFHPLSHAGLSGAPPHFFPARLQIVAFEQHSYWFSRPYAWNQLARIASSVSSRTVQRARPPAGGEQATAMMRCRCS